MSDGYRYDFFVSHASEDKQSVSPLVGHLRSAGFTLWHDQEEIKRLPLAKAISLGVQQSRRMLLFLSPNALASEWVEFELNLFQHRDPNNNEETILPIKLKPCDAPHQICFLPYTQLGVNHQHNLDDLETLCRRAKGSNFYDAAQAATQNRALPAETAQVIEEIAAAAEDKPDPQRTAQDWLALGVRALETGDSATAEGYFTQTAALSPNDPLAWVALSRLRRVRGDLASAKLAADKAVAIAAAAAQADPPALAPRHVLSQALREQVEVFEGLGDLPQARAAVTRSLDLAAALATAAPDVPLYRSEQALALRACGWLNQEGGDLAAAEARYQAALSLWRGLATEDPANASWRQEAADTLAYLGDVAQAAGDLARAKSLFQDSQGAFEELSRDDPDNTDWKRKLAVAWSKLGDVAQDDGDLAAARTAFEHDKAISEELVARDPSNAGWRRGLAVAWSKLGDVAQDDGDLAAARTAFEHDKAIFDDLVARDPSNAGWRRELAVACNKVGDVAQAAGDLAAARKVFEQGKVICEELVGRPRPQQRRLAPGPRPHLWMAGR